MIIVLILMVFAVIIVAAAMFAFAVAATRADEEMERIWNEEGRSN